MLFDAENQIARHKTQVTTQQRVLALQDFAWSVVKTLKVLI